MTTNTRIVHTAVSDAATLTVTSATFPVTNVQNTRRDSVWRSTSTATQTITGHWGGEDRKPGFLGLFRHKCHGASVRVQLFSDQAATAEVHDSGTVAIASVATIGSYRWGLNSSSNEDTDLHYALQPYGLWFTPITAKAFKVTISGTPGAYSYFEVGRLFLGPYFEPVRSARFGLPKTFQSSTDRERSGGGSNYVGAGDVWRQIAGEFLFEEDERPIWDDILMASATGRDMVLAIFAGATGRQERDYLLNGQFVSEGDLSIPSRLTRTVRLTFQEN